MRLSGVDPSVIRELSGIYKPFIKAFKELISNAYDADATTITVSLAEDFRSIVVTDDGSGMTPFTFYRDFARLGGSSAWKNNGVSEKGRRRIGFKGIGFLALARYCDELEIKCRTKKVYIDQLTVKRGQRKDINVLAALPHVVPDTLLLPRLKIRSLHVLRDAARTRLAVNRDYIYRNGVIRLISRRAQTVGSRLAISYAINCQDLVLKGRIDFHHLLSLEHKADLHLLENFCDLSVAVERKPSPAYTQIRVKNLKEFVVRELTAPRRRGRGWNISSLSGKDQFIWQLSRSTPIQDHFTLEKLPAPMQALKSIQHKTDLPKLILKWPKDPTVQLFRPLCLPKTTHDIENACIPVNIKEGGLQVAGYILATSEVLYPSECRGIGVRVRNVQIGNASFLGLERTLSGERKAALSQITGELMVLEGLDTPNAINPGRESFYEENEQYRLLRRSLMGTEELLGGAVGQAIRVITERSRLRSQVIQRVAAARLRRKVLTDISNAVNFFSRRDREIGNKISRFLSKPLLANGLSEARDIVLRPPYRMAGYDVKDTTGLNADYRVDFNKRLLHFDFESEIWSHSIYLNGKYYQVAFKHGLPTDPICEFDNVKAQVYINWLHPTKSYMDESGFLRSAIIWRLAHHVAADNADSMMELALNLLAFRAE